MLYSELNTLNCCGRYESKPNTHGSTCTYIDMWIFVFLCGCSCSVSIRRQNINISKKHINAGKRKKNKMLNIIHLNKYMTKFRTTQKYRNLVCAWRWFKTTDSISFFSLPKLEMDTREIYFLNVNLHLSLLMIIGLAHDQRSIYRYLR